MKFYCVPCRQEWPNFMCDTDPIGTPVAIKGFGDWYYPVFMTMEAAKAAFPNVTPMMMTDEDPEIPEGWGNTQNDTQLP